MLVRPASAKDESDAWVGTDRRKEEAIRFVQKNGWEYEVQGAAACITFQTFLRLY